MIRNVAFLEPFDDSLDALYRSEGFQGYGKLKQLSLEQNLEFKP
jgi:hypothetical protein